MGGVYTTIWVVPIVPAYDTEEQVRALLQLKYVDVLDAIKKGNYWLYAGDVETLGEPTLRVFGNESAEDEKFVLIVEGNHVLVSKNGLSWEKHKSLDESVAIAASNTKGVGLVSLLDGSVRTTQDGGITWHTRKLRGKLSSAAFADKCMGQTKDLCDGLYVRTTAGDNFYSEDNGASWKDVDLHLNAIDRTGTKSGEGGLDLDYEGVIRVLNDSSPSGPRRKYPLFSDNGRHGVVVERSLAVSIEVEPGSWNTNEWSWERYSGAKPKLFEFDAEGQHGLITTLDGAVRVTTDGGKTWTLWTEDAIGLNRTEQVFGAAVGSDGSRLVLGDDGTVRIWDGERWGESEGVVGSSLATAFDFGPNGLHGLVGTEDGAVHVTADRGKTWTYLTRQDLGLNRTEWAVRAAVGSDGPRLVLGDEGTVRIWDGETWAAPKAGVEWSSVTAIGFGSRGLHGMVGTRDGAVHVTADGGKTWTYLTRQDIGLNRTEWPRGAVIGSNGGRLVLGDEGTVRIWDGKTWDAPKAGAEWSSVTAFEFGPRGLHGLVWTGDSVAHVTADGGKTWTTRTQQDLGLSDQEWVAGAMIASDGVLLLGDEGTVRIRDGDVWATRRDGASQLPFAAAKFIGSGRLALMYSGAVVRTTENGGRNWVLSGELSNTMNAASDASFGVKDIHADGDRALLLFGDASAWTRRDGRWLQVSSGFGDESIGAIALDENSEPVVVGTKGATLIGGRSERGRGDLVPEENEETNIVAVAAIAGKTFALVKGKEGKMSDSIYVRGKFPYLADDVLTLVGALQEGSRLRKSLVADIPELAETLESSGDPKTLIDKLGVDQVHWLRAVATLATIYLVQLFVGLYRYSVRLSAFWDSRADAVLLSTRFSSSDLSFDDLIAALAPDALDFKPPRYPYFPSWRRPSKPRRVATTPDEAGSEV